MTALSIVLLPGFQKGRNSIARKKAGGSFAKKGMLVAAVYNIR
jgi:hypothetical protein